MTTALSGAFGVGVACAQEPAQPSPPSASDVAATLLGDVVVTATRQADTVSRVPLAVTAVGQRALDQQGIQSVDDLSRIVPSLSTTSTGGVHQFTIRGISSQGAGAATTGVYLDDTSLTKRNQQGAAANNGTPAPPLFDLERVEVLRGPQGTLYGGSSQGGTIRFITPTPSLTSYSVYGKAQASTTKHGTGSWLAGLAVGGPIVKDKLGFRVSAFKEYGGGWIDAVDPYTMQVYKQDGNYTETHAIRAVLRWRMTERAEAKFSLYSAREYFNDTDSATLPLNKTNAQLAQDATAKGWTLPANWGNISDFCINYNGTPASASARTPVSCAGRITHRYPGHVYGPWPLQPYQYVSVAGPYENNPFHTYTDVYSADFAYDFDTMRMQAIFSYIHDQQKTKTYGGTVVTQMYGGFPPWLPEDPNFMINGNFSSQTKRHGVSAEVRFSSAADARPLSWVAGVYYSNVHGFGGYENFVSADAIYGRVLGLSVLQRTGVPTLPGGSFAHRDQTLADIEMAAFGDATWHITNRLRAIAGIRVSRVQFDYHQAFYGPLNGYLVPTAENGGETNGSVVESPVTPRLGLQYQFTDNNQVYFTAAKGYRAGGVNGPLPELICAAAMQQTGITNDVIPDAFGSDTIWSYELGTKLRVLENRVALNANVFNIDWTGLQQSISLGFSCGPTFITNVGKARSRGVELEAQARLLRGLTVDFATAYNDAKVTEDTFGPNARSGARGPVVALAGQPIGVPEWTFRFGATYNFQVAARETYLRADYTLVPSYDTARSVPGTPTYTPDAAKVDKREALNLRAGVYVGPWDVSLYLNNVTNEMGGTPSPARTGCNVATGAACTTFGNYNPLLTVNTMRPREIGLQAVFRLQ